MQNRFVLLSLLVFFINVSFAQQEVSTVTSKLYEKAENYRLAYKNDSSELLLDSIIGHLETNDALYSNFGIKILQKKAFVQEAGDNNTEAIESLLFVIKIAEKYQQFSALTDAYISLARLYEKIGVFTSCLDNLNQAKTLIQEQQLDSIKPRYFVRRSSYFRVKDYPNIDSSIFYAKKALDWGHEMGKIGDATVAHMLLSMLYADSSFVLAKYHIKETMKVWRKTQDYNGLAAMMENLSKLYLKNDYIDSAFLYNDSTFLILENNKKNIMWVLAHENRSNIYKQVGELDSALFYLKKYQEYFLKHEKEKNTTAIAKIDVQFRTERNKRTILEQEQKIKTERQQNLFLG